MSADNGIYIAEFPKADGTVEYRVVEAGAIDNVLLSYRPMGEERTRLEDAYRVLYFGDARSFSDKKEAGLYALELSEERYTEYGVAHIKMDRPLVEMTSDEAMAVLR
jgi:hypothetical protein